MKHVKLFENFDFQNYQLREEENSDEHIDAGHQKRLSEIARFAIEAMQKGDMESLAKIRKFVEAFKNYMDVKPTPSLKIPNRGANIPRDFSSKTKEQLKEIAREAMQEGDMETLIQMADYFKNNTTK